MEKKLEHLRPKKKRKIQISPNFKFATIRIIREAQIAIRKRQIESVESELEEESKSSVSCIEVDAE